MLEYKVPYISSVNNKLLRSAIDYAYLYRIKSAKNFMCLLVANSFSKLPIENLVEGTI